MEKKYGLSSTEMELMEYFWSQDRALTLKEILDYTNLELKKNWKRQTLGTYLKQLQMAGLVGVEDIKKNYKYFVLSTKKEHIHQWTKKLIEKSYENSIEKFMIAFSGGRTLDKEEADKLRKLL